jgi:hypothetical protein
MTQVLRRDGGVHSGDTPVSDPEELGPDSAAKNDDEATEQCETKRNKEKHTAQVDVKKGRAPGTQIGRRP